ncbi:MAG: tetraacyldisaccharide 4'-kinase [Paracoccaceae bacterium]
MRAPAFWSQDGPLSRALAPLGWLTARATARRLARPGAHRAGIPVICVGNVNVGGTGKTPVVMDLCARIPGAHVVSRGHGGRLRGPVRVDPARHTAADVGDEPMLLSAFAPVWVARDRAAGVRAAQAAGARAVVLDDGHQNPSVARDLSLVVVDAARGFGNGRLLPAGPLREPAATGLSRADLLITIGEGDAQDRFARRWPVADRVPRLRAALRPLATGYPWAQARLLAFAGIGHPQKFFDTLSGLGAELAATRGLADHAPLSPRLLTRLEVEARARGAQLVTTEKDAARLPPAWRPPRILTLPVRLEWEDDTPLVEALRRVGAIDP